MWQSRTYNGQQASFRYLIIFMSAIIFIAQKDENEAH
jgi:predicted small integral membrane protein